MSINKVTLDSPSHFKRFYVYFDTFKEWWKKGCKPILGLNDFYLKGLYHNSFPLDLEDLKIKNEVATNLFCTGVIGHSGYMFLN